MHFLVTAGPTREALDPVRYLSNRSSGRMGYAIAEAAVNAGHKVTLVSGPVSLMVSPRIHLISVESAQQMWQAVASVIREEPPDIAILSAAVADYRPKSVSSQKIKKTADALTIELERTPDILGSMRDPFGFRGVLVGFAAETENLQAHAQAKLKAKRCDLIVANDVSRTDIGFDSDHNEVLLCFADGHTEPVPRMSKADLAALLVQRCEALRE